MRVPSLGQPLYERRIVREGKAIAERMLAGYMVTRNGRFVREEEPGQRLANWVSALIGALTPARPARRSGLWK